MYLQSYKIGCSDNFADLVTNVILQGTYRIAQKFDGKNFNELIVGFKGEKLLRDKGL